MNKELKIGIISLLTIAILIWGIQYLKGKNLLAMGYSFETVLNNVEGLEKASPVEINGLTVGAISDIRINPEDVRTMIVEFDIEGEFQLPTSTVAVNAAPSGVIGNRKIILSFDELCDGTNCLKGGERLPSKVRGLISSMMGEGEMDQVALQLKQNIGPIVDSVMASISNPENENAVGQSLQNISQLTEHLNALTYNLNRLMRASYDNLNTTANNLAEITTTFANSRENIETVMSNLSSVSSEIANANLGATLSSTQETVQKTNELLEGLKVTMSKADGTMAGMNDIVTKLNSPEGNVGKLLNDTEIYDNLATTTEHLSLLLQDMRLNPKRYVRLSIFGRKNQPYTNPEDDPAYEHAIEVKLEGN